MAKHIHIHVGKRKPTRDSLSSDYYAWAKSKSKDPQSRLTFKQYVREKGLNPNSEKQLEREAKIGTKDSDHVAIKKEGYQARKAGKVYAECPYKDPADRGPWQQGWREADAEAKSKDSCAAKDADSPDFGKVQRAFQNLLGELNSVGMGNPKPSPADMQKIKTAYELVAKAKQTLGI